LAATALLALLHPDFSAGQINSLLIIGTLAGELPDIDLFRLHFEHRPGGKHKTINHHEYITHTPIFWLVISLIVVVAGFLFGSTFTEWIGWLILAGSWSHLLLDYIEYEIKWIWPISDKLYSMMPKKHSLEITARPGTFLNYFQFITKEYIASTTFWCEMIISIVALVVLFRVF